ncbi:DUF2267 domain-containing protein [Cryptosporangium arvum]|uniref:DUF2267 domain-containing protein n=1 Tax=Cryptosporangium arvum DSM 44712 TaxID=927661 RepID=A0A010Z465_9ACTN|nr:DUF2267 domain-containing protein [Cryptosporangium arvum]EXG82178.1 hypothetical protein CryarDRAFT_3326 [Cryptosporangium arvum DSM 44712]
MAKEMEGDNRKRRALARDARDEDKSPSASGVTLGSSKQREHTRRGRRDGPPPAGAHKPGPDAPVAHRPHGDTEPTPADEPGDRATPDEGSLRLRYREVVSAAAARAGVEFDDGKSAARATIAVLAGTLDADDRRRLVAALPAELTVGPRFPAPSPPAGEADFVRTVALLAGCAPEHAQRRVQAVFAAINDEDPDVLRALSVPAGIEELVLSAP